MPHLAWTFDERSDRLDVLRVKVHEAISTPFRASVVVGSTDDDLELDELAGSRAQLTIALPEGGRRVFRGVCDRLECLHAVTAGTSTYALGLVHDLALLDQRVNHRIFQGKTTREIVTALLDEWNIDASWTLREPHPTFDVRTQYGESDYDFMSRLLVDDGISFLFVDDDGESRLVFSDVPELAEPQGPPILFVDDPGLNPTRSASHVRRAAAIRPGAVVLGDFDFRRPTFAVRGRAQGEDRSRRREVFRHDLGASLVRKEPDGDATPQADARGTVRADQPTLEVLARRELARERSGGRGVQLSTNAFEARAGAVVEIVGHPRADLGGRLLLTTTTFAASRNDTFSIGARAVFTDDGWEPPRAAAPVRVHGLQSAIVTGPAGQEIHTDEHGRVALHFAWDRVGPTDEQSSCWVRVSQGWAGGGYGLFTLPRVGHEVLVAFLDGDPDHPVVVGSLHDGANHPPHRLPENKTVSTFRTASSPGGEGWNELRFEDQRGREHVLLRAERDLETTAQSTYSVRVGAHWSSIVGGDRTRSVEGQDSSTITGSALLSVGGNKSETVLGRASSFTRGSRDEHVAGNRTLAVDGLSVERIESSASRSVRHDESVTVGRHRSVVVGSGAAGEAASATSFVHGHQTITATDGLVITSDVAVTLVCGKSRLELLPDRIVLRSGTIDVTGTEAFHARGDGPALHLTTTAEIAADEVKLYSKGASLELDADASMNGTKVRLARKNGSKSSTEEETAEEDMVQLKVRVTAPSGEAYAAKRFRLLVMGRKIEGTTGGDGSVAEDVPRAAQSAHLTVWLADYPTGPRRVWHVAIGDVAAASSPAGAKARLRNLGYRTGAGDLADDAETRAAIVAYQRDRGLPPTGELDASTSSRLTEDHGS